MEQIRVTECPGFPMILPRHDSVAFLFSRIRFLTPSFCLKSTFLTHETWHLALAHSGLVKPPVKASQSWSNLTFYFEAMLSDPLNITHLTPSSIFARDVEALIIATSLGVGA